MQGWIWILALIAAGVILDAILSLFDRAPVRGNGAAAPSAAAHGQDAPPVQEAAPRPPEQEEDVSTVAASLAARRARAARVTQAADAPMVLPAFLAATGTDDPRPVPSRPARRMAAGHLRPVGAAAGPSGMPKPGAAAAAPAGRRPVIRHAQAVELARGALIEGFDPASDVLELEYAAALGKPAVRIHRRPAEGVTEVCFDGVPVARLAGAPRLSARHLRLIPVDS